MMLEHNSQVLSIIFTLPFCPFGPHWLKLLAFQEWNVQDCTFSICFYSMSSCRWVIHQSVTPKAFVSPSSSTLTSFHPSLSDSLLSSLPFSICHLSYPNFIQVCFLAVQHPSNTSGPFHYIFPARNELRSGKVQSTMSMFICFKKLLPQPNSN